MAFRSRLVSLVAVNGRFYIEEKNGTRIPLNREGYLNGANSLKALERYYVVEATTNEDEFRLLRVRDSHKRIAPRDLGFVDRMIDHELNEETKAKRLDNIRRDADAVAPALDFEAPADNVRYAAEPIPAPVETEHHTTKNEAYYSAYVPMGDSLIVTLPPRPASPRTWYADLNPHRGQRGEKPWRVFWRDADGAHMTGIRGSRRKCERWAASANIDQPSFGCRESYEKWGFE